MYINAFSYSVWQIATNTNCSRCGKSAGTRRPSSTTCASGNADRSSPGVQRQWLRPFSQCLRRDYHYLRRPENMIYRIRHSCSTPTESTTCWAPAPMAVQVCLLSSVSKTENNGTNKFNKNTYLLKFTLGTWIIQLKNKFLQSVFSFRYVNTFIIYIWCVNLNGIAGLFTGYIIYK